jgi:hypothetical protein
VPLDTLATGRSRRNAIIICALRGSETRVIAVLEFAGRLSTVSLSRAASLTGESRRLLPFEISVRPRSGVLSVTKPVWQESKGLPPCSRLEGF